MTADWAPSTPTPGRSGNARPMSVHSGKERCMSARNHWPRRAVAVLAALTAIGVSLGTAATADATRNAVAAGHSIRTAGGSLCTLGFVFIRGGRALGITAGHCVDDGSRYIIDTDSGHRGRVVSYDYEP